MKRVAIQGIQGSNHYIVAQNYFDNKATIQECLSFDALVNCITTEDCGVGIMALENTIAGSIIPNYALIDQHNLNIVGEYYLGIHHHLMALPNQSLEDIKEVYSHPMALLQCKEFFKQHPHIKLVEDVDTADVAKRISEQQLQHVAAIAPKIAAEIFNLAILEDEIQTIKNNATRFVIVRKGTDKEAFRTLSQSKGEEKDERLLSGVEANRSQQYKEVSSTALRDQINKASLKFELDHKRGSLAAMLNVMSDCQLNLTKIQSLPKIETPWKYAFFVDVTFEDYQDYAKAKAIIEIMAIEFKILGEYSNARAHSASGKEVVWKREKVN